MNNTIEISEETVKQVWAGKIANIDLEKQLVYLDSTNIITGDNLQPIHDYSSFKTIAEDLLSQGVGAKFYQIITENDSKLCEHYKTVPWYFFDNPRVKSYWVDKIGKKYNPKQSTLNMII
jgi:hypothetical protein